MSQKSAVQIRARVENFFYIFTKWALQLAHHVPALGDDIFIVFVLNPNDPRIKRPGKLKCKTQCTPGLTSIWEGVVSVESNVDKDICS